MVTAISCHDYRARSIVHDDEAFDFRVGVQILLHFPGSVMRRPLRAHRSVHYQVIQVVNAEQRPPKSRPAALRLAVPNQTVRRLMYGYLRDGYRDVGGRAADFGQRAVCAQTPR